MTPVAVPEGDDFFTLDMDHPLAFDARRDFTWEELFDEPSVTATGGLWQGTFAATGSYVFPLFPGFSTGLNSGRLGANYPIDSTRFRLVSVRSRVSQRSSKVVYWSRKVDWPDGSLKVALADGYFTDTQLVHHPANAFVVDLYDLSANPDWTGAPVRGVRLDPSISGPAGTQVAYDWVRIVDPDSAPYLTIRWTTANVGPAGGATPKVNVYADADCQGQDGDFIGRVDYNANAFVLPTAALPPGAYCFHLRLTSGSGGDTLLAASGYSARLTVNARPTLTFLHPSRVTGPDYATEVFGNPWDMADPADVANLGNPMNEKSFINETFANGAFIATAIVVPPDPESDAQVWLHVDPARPIDTSRYRYLTYQLALDPTQYGNLSDKVMFGWVARAVWWNADIHTDGSNTKVDILYEGVNTITIDLWNNQILDLSDVYPAQTGWRANPTVSHLRIDPAETSANRPTNFYLFDVKLTGDPAPEPDGTFTVSFRTTDREGDTAQVRLYLDADRSGYDGVLLDTLVVSPGDHELAVSTADLTPGAYWVYAVVTDAWGKTVRRYADAPIRITAPPCSGRAVVDKPVPGAPFNKRPTRSPGLKPGAPDYCSAR